MSGKTFLNCLLLSIIPLNTKARVACIFVSFSLIKIGHSRPLFLYFRPFYKQLMRICSIIAANDWIWTRVLWYWKRPRCEVCHNHCPTLLFFLSAIVQGLKILQSTIKGWNTFILSPFNCSLCAEFYSTGKCLTWQIYMRAQKMIANTGEFSLFVHNVETMTSPPHASPPPFPSLLLYNSPTVGKCIK